MKYTMTFLLVILLMLTGCTVTRQVVDVDSRLELVSMSSLPPHPSITFAGKMKLNVVFRVLNDGTIAEVRVLGSSGYPDWDLAAIDSMKRWRFAVTTNGGSLSEHSIRYTIIVHAEESIVMTLSQLVAGNQREADSLYSLLKSGILFDTLAKQFRAGSSNELGRFLGAIDIARYPQHVREELRRLPANDFTHPLRLGETYLIFKRFPKIEHNALPG